MAGQQGQLKLAGDVPDARRSVPVSSHDLPSVRAECGVLGRRPVCGEGRYDLAGGGAVYDYVAVTISSDYLAAVGAGSDSTACLAVAPEYRDHLTTLDIPDPHRLVI